MKPSWIVAVLLLFALPPCLQADPAWWTITGTAVIDSAAPHTIEDNYSPANLGQLKNMAAMAKLHLDANLPNGAGLDINNMVSGFGLQSSTVDNYAPINVGQLKSVAVLFYDRLSKPPISYNTRANLIANGYPSTWASDYPWDTITPVPVEQNYAPANLGQLKAVFSFDLTGFDSDGDGLPDAWEMSNFGNLSQGPGSNSDTDGMSNLYEFLNGLNPSIDDGGLDKDGDLVFNYMDSRPSDPSKGVLAVTIAQPANGCALP